MRAVIAGDKTYFALFHLIRYDLPHFIEAKYNYSHGPRKGQSKKLCVKNATHCTIKVGNTKDNPTSLTATEICSTVSYCAYDDDFDLHKGRREALKKAIQEAGLGAISHLFWAEFVKTLPKPEPSIKQLKRKLRIVNERIEKLNDTVFALNLGGGV